MNENEDVGVESPTSFSEIYIDIEVNPINRMSAKYKLIALGDSSISTEIEVVVKEDSDIPTEITPVVIGNSVKDSIIDIAYRGNLDIATAIQPYISKDMQAEIEVPPHNRMWAIYEVQQPPIISQEYSPTKDSFVRKQTEYEAINYGSNISMVAGRRYGDEWSSYLQFNVSDFDKSYKTTDIKLKVYYNGVVPEGVKVSLYTANKSWNEYGITYLNKPDLQMFVTDEYVVNETERYFEFDVTDVVNNWIQDRIENNGFVITLSDDSYDSQVIFRTRESTTPPELIINHYDARIFSTGRSQILSQIEVVQRGNNDLATEIEVDSVFSISELATEIYCHRVEDPVHEDYPAEITVTKEYIFAEITPVRNGYSVVATEIEARTERITTLATEIFINKPFMLAEIEIMYKGNSDIQTEITPVVVGGSSVPTAISANRDIIQSEIFVRALGNADIPTQIESFGYFYSEIPTEITSNRDYIPTEITSRVGGESTIYTSIVANKPNIHAEIEVKYRSDIPVEIDVMQKSDILAVIDVDKKNLPTEITVVRTESNSIDVELYVPYYSDVEAEITSFIYSQVPTQITAMTYEQIETEIAVTRNQILAEITFPYYGTSDAPTEIQPRILRVSDVNAVITVSGAKKGYAFII